MPDLDTLSREDLIALIHQLVERIAALEKENEALRAQLPKGGKGNAIPLFVKPNRKPRSEAPRPPRKKRAAAFVRRREKPTEKIDHSLDYCPDCGRKLEGGWEHTRRQVIELPDNPVRIIDHVLIARRCGICRKVHVPSLGVEDGVVGQHRVGPRLMSMVAMWCTHCRIPQETVQGMLHSIYQLHLSVGEITEILHSIARRGKHVADGILEEIRTAPFVHADETGWREDGVNGYLWSFSTPTSRYFYRDGSRAGQVARDILSDRFSGVLVCDCYSGYSWYTGPIQRCWDHFSRDLKELKAKQGENASVASFVDAVFKLYARAKKAATVSAPPEIRIVWRRSFEEELRGIARPYIEEVDAPQRELACHIERFYSEYFTFVQHAGVPPGNNAAERAIRPAVTARKISGGTRSAKGSSTKATLMTLFGTWALRGQDGLRACLELLTTASISPRAAPA